MNLKAIFIFASLSFASAVLSQEGGGCPACTVIQAQQRGSLDSGHSQLTVPKGELNMFTMMSPNSQENRTRLFLKTGITDRFDTGLGWSRSGNRATLQLTWQAVDMNQSGAPFNLLVGYGFSSTYADTQEGLYAMAVRPIGRASVIVGGERLRNGRNIGFVASSYQLNQKSGLMFYSHTGAMSGDPTLYNISFVHRFGTWQAGIWYFHPSREKTVGLSLSRQFELK
ncbi:MAG: hypothetical protein KIT45_08130 [Fimbriimonadia bacterium]|nr:hypothetical protein [Fimbriimonadia bacterium]